MFVNALFTALEHVRTRFHHLDHQIAQGHCPLMLACYRVLKNMSCSWTLVPDSKRWRHDVRVMFFVGQS